MRVAAAVLTHNAFRHGRIDALRATVRSLAAQRPDALFIVSNGSDDGTGEYVASLGGTVVDDPVRTCGHGMNVAIGAAARAGDLVVFSNDDIVWHPDALAALRAFWAAAPPDLAIASGLLEDAYPWNTVRERVDYGGVPALIRDTAPGGAWTLRAADWPAIRPVPEARGWDDVPVCRRLRAAGRRVAQIDLADHIGADRSTWGNASAPFGRPLDRAAWGLP